MEVFDIETADGRIKDDGRRCVMMVSEDKRCGIKNVAIGAMT